MQLKLPMFRFEQWVCYYLLSDEESGEVHGGIIKGMTIALRPEGGSEVYYQIANDDYDRVDVVPEGYIQINHEELPSPVYNVGDEVEFVLYNNMKPYKEIGTITDIIVHKTIDSADVYYNMEENPDHNVHEGEIVKLNLVKDVGPLEGVGDETD